jgi:hypothetical protein
MGYITGENAAGSMGGTLAVVLGEIEDRVSR